DGADTRWRIFIDLEGTGNRLDQRAKGRRQPLAELESSEHHPYESEDQADDTDGCKHRQLAPHRARARLGIYPVACPYEITYNCGRRSDSAGNASGQAAGRR